MTLNLNSEWNTYRALETDKIISNMFTVSDKNCYVSVGNSSACYNVTPEHVRSFYDAKERMEREVKEAELRKSQMQNKRLRAMVKKVIFSGDRTIIMWNDGTKTVTQCHELDVYDKEKGILACMAKKLYDNTNLFNEVIQEYVDFDTCNIESEENEYKKTIAKLQTTLDVADSTIYDLEKELAYYKRLAEKLTNDVDSYMVDMDSLEIFETLKEYKHYTKCLEEDLENEHLNREEMENIYYSLQTQFDAYVKQCSIYQEDIKLLESRIASRDEQIKDLEEEINALEEERNLLQDELDSVYVTSGNYN